MYVFVLSKPKIKMGSLACCYFFNHSFYMADNKFNNWVEHQQRSSSRMAFYYPGIDMQLPYFKRVFKMATVKWALIVMDILGIPTWVLGVMARLYFFVVDKRISIREKEIELWHLEQDKQDRINKSK